MCVCGDGDRGVEGQIEYRVSRILIRVEGGIGKSRECVRRTTNVSSEIYHEFAVKRV